VIISKEMHRALKRIAVELGVKLYIVCDDLLKLGMEARSEGKVMTKTRSKKILKQVKQASEETIAADSVSILEEEGSASGNRGVSAVDLKF